MTLRRDDRIIRVGDIVTPIRHDAGIKRIGYALIFTELRDEARQSPEADAIAKILFGNSFASGLSLRSDPAKIPSYIVDAVAKSFVEKRNFGGNERSIHYYPPNQRPARGRMHAISDHPSVDTQYRVTSKFFAKTGTRYGSWGSGEDYEDGGLKDAKTHVILELDKEYKIRALDVRLVMRGHNQ